MVLIMKHNLQKLILELISETERLHYGDITPKTVAFLRAQAPEAIASRKVKPKYVINRTIKRLEDRGMIRYVVTETRRLAHLTPEGEERLAQLRGYEHYLATSKPWDGRWRMLILNFSEDLRSTRDAVRRILKDLGFRSLKSSLWVTPHDCARLVAALREDYNLTDELIYIVADHLEPLSTFEE